MRTSQAGLAYIRRVGPDGDVEYLTQWSESWSMFSLIGGHVEPGETFRECCLREVEEELRLQRSEFTVGDSLGRIEYEAFSHGCGQMTRYTVELFAVEVRGNVSDDPTNRWLSEREIATMTTGDGLPVSDQVRIVLARTGVIHMAKIFVSATTKGLKSYRLAAAEKLRELGHEVVVQDEFPMVHLKIAPMLAEQIAPCDAVVLLIGRAFGAKPANWPQGIEWRSYTQLEYDLALELQKPVFRFVATATAQLDPYDHTEDPQSPLQDAYIRSMADFLFWSFSSQEQLRKSLEQSHLSGFTRHNVQRS
jgi:ADP-ribose pyrophosphatase YjhB (NUDIX family)